MLTFRENAKDGKNLSKIQITMIISSKPFNLSKTLYFFNPGPYPGLLPKHYHPNFAYYSGFQGAHLQRIFRLDFPNPLGYFLEDEPPGRFAGPAEHSRFAACSVVVYLPSFAHLDYY